MTDIIRWLTSYNSEYDVENKTLRIKKPMPVAYFVALRKILLTLRL